MFVLNSYVRSLYAAIKSPNTIRGWSVPEKHLRLEHRLPNHEPPVVDKPSSNCEAVLKTFYLSIRTSFAPYNCTGANATYVCTLYGGLIAKSVSLNFAVFN